MVPFTPGIEVRIASREDLGQIRELALMIFPATYEKIVEEGQVEYMMDLIYTKDSLEIQLEEGQIFLIIYYEGQAAGFAAYSRLNDSGDFKLNKIYVDYSLHGKGIGRWLLSDVLSRVRAEGGKYLQLNVNRHNKARGFYESMGFSLLKEDKVDIGNGFFMDDYVLVMKLI
jgi:diamine N-acetyltransferase